MGYDLSETQHICSTKTLYVHKNSINEFLKQRKRARVEAVIALGCMILTAEMLEVTADWSCCVDARTFLLEGLEGQSAVSLLSSPSPALLSASLHLVALHYSHPHNIRIWLETK